jgi:hypothetical protein
VLYIFGTICGIAILFLLKFAQVANSELRSFGTAWEMFNPKRGDMFKKVMFRKREDGTAVSARPTYAAPRDFCRIFAEDKTALYLLSLVLTADSEKAEQCFAAGLVDSIGGNPVFKEWARSWTKRMIIKNAIGMITPAPGRVDRTRQVSDRNVLMLGGGLLTAVRELSPFERFVFVMSILEKYSIQECSILLNCTKQEVSRGQARALQQLAAADLDRTSPIPGTDSPRAAYFLEPARTA